MEDLTPEKKAQLHEVRDLMLEIYQTLVRMRYLKPGWIQEGPHDLDSHKRFHESLDLDPSIQYLYRILPYVHNRHLAFFQGSVFADFRDKDTTITCTSAYSSTGNVLSSANDGTGDGSAAQVQDGQGTPTRDASPSSPEPRAAAAGHHDADDGHSSHSEGDGTDQSDQEMEDTEAESVDDDDEEDEEGDEDMDGEDEDWSSADEDDEEINGEAYNLGNGRPAPDVLRDIILWFKSLDEFPSGEHAGPGWELEDVAPLYRKHGWPGDDFDGDAFEIDHARLDATSRILSHAGHVPERIQALQGSFIPYQKQGLETVRARLATASTPEEEWAARWELFRDERRLQHMQAELADLEATTARLNLNEQLLPPHEARGKLAQFRGELEKSDSQYSRAYCEDMIAESEEAIRLHEGAIALAEADAKRLAPSGAGDAVTSENGLGVIKSLGPTDWRADLEGKLREERATHEAYAAWLADMPDEVPQAKAKVESQVRLSESVIESYLERLANMP
ncbi:unnamed protein product [Parascedosporium putredinis]|uniref:Uncharacterized protein n=1 Tax=Parascedosporium putredinis TaxID=1442378 RepID=A0A9P1MDS4_9PEZI|nr:unnamed protein product [Parascedosporium putredinis]CAI8004228.1 unnamed protein product [Parascedosporium putredinis]